MTHTTRLLPAVPGGPDSEGTALDRVTAELAYLFGSPKATIGMRQEAELDLMPVVTPKATAASAAAQDQNRGVRAMARGMLLERGDISMLNADVEMLLDPEQAFSDNDVSVLASGLQAGVKNPETVPSLAKLLHCRFAGIGAGRRRRSAILGAHPQLALFAKRCEWRPWGSIPSGDWSSGNYRGRSVTRPTLD